MRTWCVLFVILLAACSPGASEMKPQEEVSDRAIERFDKLSYGAAWGYLAKPSGQGPYPAVILIHEWWGLNDNIREFADLLAEQGYTALAVDLYGGESTDDPERAGELASAVRLNMEEAFINLRSAVSFLRRRSDVDSSNLASIGWCFGGGWSYQMAKNNLGVQASIIYYGQFNPKDDLQKMRATILGHFGEEDRSISKDSVEEFQATLNTLSGDHEIYIYENAGHGFARELTSENAQTAWERTLRFLEEQL